MTVKVNVFAVKQPVSSNILEPQDHLKAYVISYSNN